MMTNVVVHRLVPVVSELGWDEVGMEGTYQGFVSSFVIWVPCRRQQRGTWFPLVGAGGFRGGGSSFCACGHPFVFVLGHTSLFRRSSLLSGQLDNDERQIRIRRSSFGRHVTISDVASGMCVSKEKGWG